MKLTHLISITLFVAIWILAVLGLILYLPSDSLVSPTIWVHGTAVLLLLILVKRFGYDIKTIFALNSIKWQWIVIAMLVAVVYWLVDHWLMTDLFELDSSAAIKSWQLANSQYHISTVLISSVLLAPFFEELLFRGLIFKQLSNQVNLWVSAIISALLFAVIHWSWPEFISLFTAGLIYALLLKKSNSLIVPLVAHLTHNLITFLYYSY